MVNIKNLIERDLKHVWHPCMQMKDFEQCPPFVVNSAKGSYLYTDKGPLIDAISSWWCKSLGHSHPDVIDAIQGQLKQFEHVIGANSTNPLITELAEALSAMTQKQHVFFASDGSCAVEIAMKLAIHANQLKGRSQRKAFISLKNSYHGETLATLSVSDVGLYKKPFQHFGLECHFIESMPYVSGNSDPKWHDSSAMWEKTLPFLEALKERVCAIMVEPIVQGAGGMLCYSADFLKKLALWAFENDIYLIADEIMTGFGRTGRWLACEHAGISPDFICLSKGMTSGSLPLSCVLIDHPVFELFYDDYASGKAFLHSHTYSDNPLAVSAALATIKAMRNNQIIEQTEKTGDYLRHTFVDMAHTCGKLKNIRSLGVWVAAELEASKNERIGYQIYQEALQRGALLRPLGNTLYWLPPLNIQHHTIDQLAEITLDSINRVYQTG